MDCFTKVIFPYGDTLSVFHFVAPFFFYDRLGISGAREDFPFSHRGKGNKMFLKSLVLLKKLLRSSFVSIVRGNYVPSV